ISKLLQYKLISSNISGRLNEFDHIYPHGVIMTRISFISHDSRYYCFQAHKNLFWRFVFISDGDKHQLQKLPHGSYLHLKKRHSSFQLLGRRRSIFWHPISPRGYIIPYLSIVANPKQWATIRWLSTSLREPSTSMPQRQWA